MRHLIVAAVLTCVAFAQTLPDAPSASKKVADKRFWALTVFNGAATLADAITTAKLVSHTQPCPYEVGTPFLYGERAHDGRVFAVMAGKALMATALSYILKRHNAHVGKFKLWPLPLAYNAYGHMLGAAHNIRFCQ